MSNRQHRFIGYRLIGILAGLLVLLTPYTGSWSQGTRRPAEDTHQRSAAPGLSVVVQQGRLSVDLQAADLAQVLAHIGRQANIRMIPGPSSGKRVSARFEGVKLEEGIRRLLRLASLNHSFLYARGSTGAVAIAEVRVLGEGKDAIPSQATVAEPGVQEQEIEPQTAPDPKPRRQARMGSEAPQPVQVVVPETTPEQAPTELTEVTRRIREVFKLGKGMGRAATDSQESSPSEPK